MSAVVCMVAPPPLQAIVWTDEAIDQLLDRSKLDAQPEAAETAVAAGGNDILAGFKVGLMTREGTASLYG